MTCILYERFIHPLIYNVILQVEMAWKTLTELTQVAANGFNAQNFSLLFYIAIPSFIKVTV